MWTVLGGNKGKLRNFEFHEAMLAEVGSYRRQARKHISDTLDYLRELSADLEVLRVHVNRPPLVDDQKYGSLEEHLDTIKKAVRRLEAGRELATARRLETKRRMLGRAEA